MASPAREQVTEEKIGFMPPYAAPVKLTSTPTNPVKFNTEICNGCNNCVKVCIADLFIPNP